MEFCAQENEMSEQLNIVRVRVVHDYLLRLEFANGEIRQLDFRPYLDGPPYEPLRNPYTFRNVQLENGMVCWPDKIAIAPETLYERSTPV